MVKKGDPTCTSSAALDVRAFSPTLVNKLNKIMPGLARTPQSFWKYEYDKHGACKVMLAKMAGEPQTQKQLMVLYFEQIGNLYDIVTRRINWLKASFNGQSDLARAMGVNVKNIQVTVVIVR